MIKDPHSNPEDEQAFESEKATSFSAPYRHRGYKKTLNALRDALEQDSAAILKGVEGTGKSTLINELIIEYQHRAVPIVTITSPLQKAAQLYAHLADTLGVAKEKKALISALRNTREAGQFCLVVIDQDAINSSPEVTQALHQLCKTSETTAGAIKLVVVCKDYLVIHAEGTPEADFHDWIEKEIILEPLQTDDIEGFIYYLCALKNLQPTPYEMGSDFMMIEHTEGKIGRLKALLLPLVHNDVITRNNIAGPERSVSMPTFDKKRMGLVAVGCILLLVIGISLQLFVFSGSSQTEVAAPVPASVDQPIFAETPTVQKPDTAISPPSLPETAKASEQLDSTNIENAQVSSNSGNLPILNPTLGNGTELDNDTEAAAITPTVDTASQAIFADTNTSSEKPSSAKGISVSSMSDEEFQQTVNAKLDLLEQQLALAIAENQRLKDALNESKEAPAETETTVANTVAISNQPDSVSNTPDSVAETITASNPASGGLPITLPSSDTETFSSEGNSVSSPKANAETSESSQDEVIAESQAEQLNPTKNSDTNLLNTSIDQAISTVDTWQDAWANKNHEDYVSAYVEGFNGAYRTHQRWLKKRYDALNRPDWIKLNRENIFNIREKDNEIRMDFWLSYEASSGYADKTLKRLTLVQEDGQWRIQREQNIQVKHPF